MTATTPTPSVHVFFVLDRSGSMEPIQSDVIGGFNAFLAQQRQQPGDCRMTLVQFDTQDPHEIVADALPLSEVPALDRRTFVPRSGTPLYDAMGHVIADATIRAEKRAAAGEPDEEVIFVTFTDGKENSSREYDRDRIFDLIRKREERGWSFVYLGANHDAYAESGAIGYRRGSVQTYSSDSRGTRLAFESVSSSLATRRARLRRRETIDPGAFFEGEKPAEADERERSAGSGRRRWRKRKLH